MRVLAALLVSVCAGCATTPIVLTKTVPVEVPVPVLQKIPSELSADCPPLPLQGTDILAVLTRLANVENALKDCRDRLSRIRALP